MLDILKQFYSKCIRNPDGFNFTIGLYYNVAQEGFNTLLAVDDNGDWFYMTFENVYMYFKPEPYGN